MAKQEYAAALRTLEQISDDIHRCRERNKLNEALASMPREEGVGAESDDDMKKLEACYHRDLILGETVDGLDRNEKLEFHSTHVLSDDDSDQDDVNDDRLTSRGERPSVSGSEGNSKDEGLFSDVDLS